ncbi:hypothetical protein MMC30_004412 [Trapelia coarctata]|nr:hypothetical protein [Trapelia coarctata]
MSQSSRKRSQPIGYTVLRDDNFKLKAGEEKATCERIIGDHLASISTLQDDVKKANNENNENNELKSRVATLQKQVKVESRQANKDMQKLQSLNAKYCEDILRLEGDLKQAENDKAILEHTVKMGTADLSERFFTAENILIQFSIDTDERGRIADMANAYLNQQILSLRDANEQASRVKAGLEQDHQNFVGIMRRIASNLREDFKRAQSTNLGLKNQLADLQVNFKQVDDDNHIFRGRVESLENTGRQMFLENDKLKERNSSLERQVTNLNKNLNKNLSTFNESSLRTTSSNRLDLDRVTIEKNGLDQLISAFNAELLHMPQQIDKRVNELLPGAAHAMVAAQIHEFAKLFSLGKDIKHVVTMDDLLDLLITMYNAQVDMNDELGKECTTKTDRIKTLSEELIAANDAKSRLETANGDRATNIKTLSRDLTTANDKITKSNSKINKLENALTERDDRIEAQRREHESRISGSRIETVERESKEREDRLKSELEQSQEANAFKANRIETVERKSKDREEQQEWLEFQIVELGKSIAEKEKRIEIVERESMEREEQLLERLNEANTDKAACKQTGFDDRGSLADFTFNGSRLQSPPLIITTQLSSHATAIQKIPGRAVERACPSPSYEVYFLEEEAIPIWTAMDLEFAMMKDEVKAELFTNVVGFLDSLSKPKQNILTKAPRADSASCLWIRVHQPRSASKWPKGPVYA